MLCNISVITVVNLPTDIFNNEFLHVGPINISLGVSNYNPKFYHFREHVFGFSEGESGANVKLQQQTFD